MSEVVKEGAYSGDTKTDSSQEIVIEMQILSDTVERLAKAVDGIGSKIEPIMASPPPPEPDTEAKLIKEISAPLAGQIQSIKDRINASISTLDNFIGRIQV